MYSAVTLFCNREQTVVGIAGTKPELGHAWDRFQFYRQGVPCKEVDGGWDITGVVASQLHQ